jgi:hypothetical protein
MSAPAPARDPPTERHRRRNPGGGCAEISAMQVAT